jgi:hypothetical protein
MGTIAWTDLSPDTNLADLKRYVQQEDLECGGALITSTSSKHLYEDIRVALKIKHPNNNFPGPEDWCQAGFAAYVPFQVSHPVNL